MGFPLYTTRADVLNQLYAGSSTGQQPTNAARDAVIDKLLDAVCRQFDAETGRPRGAFGVTYESRLYSGKGLQEMHIDEAAVIVKVEFNSTIAGVPSWNNISSDFATSIMTIKPIRFWPKNRLMRQATFITDPWDTGNYRLTGIWGAIQPDMNLVPPTGGTPAWNGLTDPQIQALAPNPSGPPYGWWATPTDVSEACNEWIIYRFKAAQASQSNAGGVPRAKVEFSNNIPGTVMDVIRKYKGASAKLALIGIDGSDATDDTMRGGIDYAMRTRWASWQTIP